MFEAADWVGVYVTVGPPLGRIVVAGALKNVAVGIAKLLVPPTMEANFMSSRGLARVGDMIERCSHERQIGSRDGLMV